MRVAAAGPPVPPDPGDARKLPAAKRLPPATEFPPRARAIHLLHFPEAEADAELARRRLALDEFISLQRQIIQRRRNFETKAQALPCGGDNRLIKPFLARLGFKLTPAQTRVLRELRHDLSGALPMRRLLQGDVGSGKTVVAAGCALMTLESGYNVALMAPTEILAEQHFRNFTTWLVPLGVQVELQTGSHKAGDQPQPAEKEQSQPTLLAPAADTQHATRNTQPRNPLHRHPCPAHRRLRAAQPRTGDH